MSTMSTATRVKGQAAGWVGEQIAYVSAYRENFYVHKPHRALRGHLPVKASSVSLQSWTGAA